MALQYEADVANYLVYLQMAEQNGTLSVIVHPLDHIANDPRVTQELNRIFNRRAYVVTGDNMIREPINLTNYGCGHPDAGSVGNVPMLPTPSAGIAVGFTSLPHDVATVPWDSRAQVIGMGRDVVGQVSNAAHRGLYANITEMSPGGGLVNAGGNYFTHSTGLAAGDTSLTVVNNPHFNSAPVQPPAIVANTTASVNTTGDMNMFGGGHIRVNSAFTRDPKGQLVGGLSTEHFPDYTPEIQDARRVNINGAVHPELPQTPLRAEYANPTPIGKGRALDGRESSVNGVVALDGSHNVIDDTHVHDVNRRGTYASNVKVHYYNDNKTFNDAMNFFAASLRGLPHDEKMKQMRRWNKHNKLRGF